MAGGKHFESFYNISNENFESFYSVLNPYPKYILHFSGLWTVPQIVQFILNVLFRLDLFQILFSNVLSQL